MATGGARRLYEEDDKLDEYLLNQVSKWVLYHRLPSLARDLGISQAQFSRIVGAHSQPEEQIFQVNLWQNDIVINLKRIQHVITDLFHSSNFEKLIGENVWHIFQSKIIFFRSFTNGTTAKFFP